MNCPLKNIQIIPFNLSHAKSTGEFARVAFTHKTKLKLQHRNIIPNDTKLFAQADVESSIGYYLSSDSESKKIYDIIVKEDKPKFRFLDLNVPYSEVFGVLDL